MENGVLLFNCSHHERRPQGPRAAFRLLGAFASEAEAKEHCRGLPGDCDVLLARLGAAFALTRSREKDEAAHLQALLQVHTRRLRDHEREFTENVAEQRTGEARGLAAADLEGGAGGGGQEARGAPLRIPRAAEVRFQNYAVLSVLHDFDEPCGDRQEPAAVVWGVYDTEDGAKEAIRKKHAAFVKDLHLEVCSLYEWLHPTEVGKALDELEEEFRDETLTKIIAQRKQERQSVKAFRELCGEKPAPLLDLSGPEVRRSGEALPGSIAELSEGATEVAAGRG
jgi:hypothetical protein